MAAQFVELLAEWLIRRQGQGIEGFYERQIWADMKKIVDQFLEQVENDAELYSISCDDIGWWKEGNINWHNADDKVVCKMMVPALFFMNGWGLGPHGGYDASAAGDRLQTYIRCIIVNVFMFQLMKANCGRNQGIRQALHILDQFMATVPNAVNLNMCTWVINNDLRVGGKVIGEQFDEWIMGNAKMKAKMKQLQERVKCKSTGKQTSDHWKRRMELLKEGQLRGAMEKGMKRILKKVGKKVKTLRGPVPSEDDDEDDGDDEDPEEDDASGNEEAEINGKKAHRFFSSNKFAILFLVACICLTHPDDFETQEEHVAKLRVHNRVPRSLAKIKAIASEDELELDPMAFEHYDGAYDDVDEPYAPTYQSPPKRIYSRNQWTTPKKRCYRDGAGTILKEWKIVEYEVPQQVHYERKWKIQHDAREEEVHNGDTLSADVAVSASVEKSSTSLSKVGAQGSLSPSLQNKGQNEKESRKTKQELKGSSGSGTTGSTGISESTKHGKQNEAVSIKSGRGCSRRKLATYITYSWNGYNQYVLTSDIPVLLPKAKAKVPKKILKDQNFIRRNITNRRYCRKIRGTEATRCT
ncbi:hypothetical protein AK88_03557 [Plasmodium fragile]|uniref:Schizont-infected cell agglutination extracellular alpha domain-containing protein n=1 Tax=Plasmodium fragile TaxID=5857 RepID=A0A0D9QIR1_PLAFR|nr:uncharacterized protein AK88_03557 [Plasmodium fragile]KJP86848.1 hypothetical protein AK88_03557 [Plasmodium fragile]